MRQIIIVILLLISSVCFGTEKKQPDIDLEKVESFLSRIYFELKCPGHLMQNDLKLEVCLYSLTYDLDADRILFAFTAYQENNRFLKSFNNMDEHVRQKSLFELLEVMSKYVGVLPVNKGVDKSNELYSGAIQRTPMTHVYDSESIKKNRIIHDFVRDNAVVGIRVIDGDMRYVAFLDLNHDMHYKEGIDASVLDFETRPTSEMD